MTSNSTLTFQKARTVISTFFTISLAQPVHGLCRFICMKPTMARTQQQLLVMVPFTLVATALATFLAFTMLGCISECMLTLTMTSLNFISMKN